MSTTSLVNSTQNNFDYTSLNAKKTTTSATSTTEAQDRFLKLLTTQLKNQDPLNPLDNAQMTSQMAQINMVEGIERLNTTLKAMMGNSTESQAMQAAGMVGHGVLVPGTSFAFSEGEGVGGFELSGAADNVTVSIKDASGALVRTLDLGGMKVGTNTFSWNGKDLNDTLVGEGSYKFSVSAKQGGKTVDATALQFGMVSSVMTSSQGVSLNVDGLGVFKMSDVREIL